MKFFQRLLNSKDPLSSKRFISIICLFLFVLVVVKSLTGQVIQPEIIYALTALITAGIGATLVSDKNNNLPNA